MDKDKTSFKKLIVFFVLNSCRQYLFKILVKKVHLAGYPNYQIKIINFKQFDYNKKKKLMMKIYQAIKVMKLSSFK